MRLVRLSLLVALVASCGSRAQRVEPEVPSPPAADLSADTQATAGVEHPELRALLYEHWEATMARFPVWATELHDRRFDDQLPDLTQEAREAHRESQSVWLHTARSLPDTELSASDRVTRALFAASLETSLAVAECRFEQWSFSARRNPLGSANYLAELHLVESVRDAETLLSRYRLLPGNIRQEIANLRAGLQDGYVANAASTKLVVEMVDRQLAQPVAEWPLYGPVEVPPDEWSQADSDAFREELARLVDEDIRAALTAYRDFLHDEVLPVARGEGEEGVGALPTGEDCYAALVRKYTTLPTTAAALHQTGLDELTGIHSEFRTIGERALGEKDLAKIFARLRNDPELRFETAEQVEDKAATSLAAAAEVVHEWFGRLPAVECTVERIPDYEAPYTTIAYYRPPIPGGVRPGTYFINVYAPETRPRHEAAVPAFHESIPGHHFQIAISQELEQLPAFRRHDGMTVFVEGWALYTERLADEMGLYADDLDRLGMLSFDSWRAARLVVDTGIHHLGWSRQQAIDFLHDNTPLATNNIANEVDRYITTPGQALAYKTGQLEIRKLRADAEATLGDRFDIRAFHDVILGSGAVSIPVLQDQVRAWVEDRQATGPQ